MKASWDASPALLVFFSALSSAQVPQRLGYQGRLLGADGLPEPRAVVEMRFSLFDAPTGGSARWSETQQVGLSNGYYSVQLGAQTAFPSGLFDGSDVYLEIALGAPDGGVDPPLLPRQRLSSVAYAHRAALAVNVSGGTVDATRIDVNGVPVVDGSGQVLPSAGSAFARSAHTHDAAELVSGVLAVSRIPQGVGSTLDADLLDGVDSSAFARVSDLSTPGTFNAAGNPVDWTRLKNVPPLMAATDGGVPVQTDSSLVGNGTAGAPLGIDPAEVQRRIGSGCPSGSFIQSVDLQGVPTCGLDQDTTYSVAGGLVLTGTTLALPTCGSQQVLKFDVGTAQWTCAVDTVRRHGDRLADSGGLRVSRLGAGGRTHLLQAGSRQQHEPGLDGGGHDHPGDCGKSPAPLEPEAHRERHGSLPVRAVLRRRHLTHLDGVPGDGSVGSPDLGGLRHRDPSRLQGFAGQDRPGEPRRHEQRRHSDRQRLRDRAVVGGRGGTERRDSSWVCLPGRSTGRGRSRAMD